MSKPDFSGAIVPAIPIATTYPIFGEIALIMLAALFGSLVALSRHTPRPTRVEAALFIFRGVAFASFCAGVAAAALSDRFGLDYYRALSLVSFFIAFIGDDWAKIKEFSIDRWVKKS